MLSEKRGRTTWVTLGLAALVLVVVGVIPMPDRRFGSGVVESTARSGVFAQADGFVVESHARPGQRVKKNDPIITMESDDLTERRRGQAAQLEQMEIEERRARKDDEAAMANLAAERARVLRESIEELDRRIELLIVRAPHDGVIVTGNPAHLRGAFLRRGQAICEVVDPSSLRVAVSMDQRQGGWLFESAGGESGESEGASSAPLNEARTLTPTPETFVADFRLYSDVERVLGASRVDIVPAGMRQLASPALGFAGGGLIETMQEDKSGRTAKRPQFSLRLHASDPEGLVRLCLPGERVLVRFKRPARPLLSQWIERLRKEVQGRVQI